MKKIFLYLTILLPLLVSSQVKIYHKQQIEDELNGKKAQFAFVYPGCEKSKSSTDLKNCFLQAFHKDFKSSMPNFKMKKEDGVQQVKLEFEINSKRQIELKNIIGNADENIKKVCQQTFENYLKSGRMKQITLLKTSDTVIPYFTYYMPMIFKP